MLGRRHYIIIIIAIGVVASLAVLPPVLQGSTLFTKTITATTTETTTTTIATSVLTTTVTSTVTSTTISTTTIPPPPPQIPDLPTHGTGYLTTAEHCSGGVCFSGEFSEAYIFTCLKEAATPQGCTVRVNATDSMAFYMVTVRYPYVNKTVGWPSWANCAYSFPGENPNQYNATAPSYCVQIGANGFILTQPPGVPP